MDHNALLHLQNGSDIRGVACEGIAGENVTLTADISCRIGYAFVKETARRLEKDPASLRIAVGRDSRITGEALATAFMQGVMLAGATAVDCSLATTPAMFMALIYPETACDASCMVTASHLPFNRNGLKFFTKEGGFEMSDITALLTKAAQIPDEVLSSGGLFSDTTAPNMPVGADSDPVIKPDDSMADTDSVNNPDYDMTDTDSVVKSKYNMADTDLSSSEKKTAALAECSSPESFDLMALYASHLQNIIRKAVHMTDEDSNLTCSAEPLSAQTAFSSLTTGDSVLSDTAPLAGLHIVVDAGNGNGGFFATKVLEPLGADISGSQFLEPDGHFPNHIPNPENKEAMASICEATVRAGADLGLIFDTDVDRMSAVFANGQPVNRDACIALAAAILAPAHKGATIVTDSVTSDRLTRFLEEDLGLKHLCYKRGYKNVINKCKELNADGIDCPLAMETSGHGCLKENYYLDDGAYLAVQFVIALAKTKHPDLKSAVCNRTVSLPLSHVSPLSKKPSAPALQETPSIAPLSEIPSVHAQPKSQGTLLPDDEADRPSIHAEGSLSDSPALSSARRDPLAGMIHSFSRAFSDREVRFTIREKDFAAYGEKVLDTFRKHAMKKAYDLPHSYEGVRIRFSAGLLSTDFHGGWLLLRASLHDPVMVLNMEGETATDLDTVTNTAKELLHGFSGLDISPLAHHQ